MANLLRARKIGVVTKIIKASPSDDEIAEISVEGADPLYREIRISNSFEGDGGKKVKLTEGSLVSITIEAEQDGLTSTFDR